MSKLNLNFPNRKSFSIQTKFPQKIGKPIIPKITTKAKVQWSANKNSFGSFEKDEATKSGFCLMKSPSIKAFLHFLLLVFLLVWKKGFCWFNLVFLLRFFIWFLIYELLLEFFFVMKKKRERITWKTFFWAKMEGFFNHNRHEPINPLIINLKKANSKLPFDLLFNV